jgi:PTH1 family peptidyl-tRNA hydrolase
MRLIIGLGNPGEKYKNTRHNAGFLVVDELQKTKLPKDFIVKKSGTFMNDSGSFVKSLYTKYNLQNTDLYIIHDDLDIPLGSFKIQLGKGPKDHNGIKSVDETLGIDEYWHVRIGVDNRPLDNRPMGEEYVLQNFSDEERLILNKVIKEICKKLATSSKNIN